METLSQTSGAVKRNRTQEPGFGATLEASGLEKAKLWTEHKAAAQALAPVASRVLGVVYGESMGRCSGILALEALNDGALRARPWDTCKRRWCPVCAWRLSLKRWGLVSDYLPGMLEAHGKPVRWLLLTLTVRNCALDDTRATVQALGAAFRRLTNSKTKLGRMWPGVGWIRSIEVTVNPDTEEAHPHMHVLVAVPPSYFHHHYASKAEWQRRWRDAAQLDYDPVIDVRRVKPLAGMPDASAALAEGLGGVREVAKYAFKPADLARSPELALRALVQLKHLRLLECGGFLRGLFDDDAVPDDLPASTPVSQYWWRCIESVYRQKLG